MHNVIHQMNRTQTENGAEAFASSGSAVLDFFAMAGGMRSAEPSRILLAFERAWNENSTLALRALFNLRDVRGGAGERRAFRICMQWLANTHVPVNSLDLVKLVPEFGRWDDVVYLATTLWRPAVDRLIRDQIVNDVNAQVMGNGSQSLLAKWLPSENASSKTTKAFGKEIRKMLKLTPRSYRKLLTHLRAQLNLVESQISTNKWAEVDYGKIPSRAGFVYRKAFGRHDTERYTAFFQKAAKGEVKMNSATLFPHEIVREAMCYAAHTDYLEAAWKNLPDLFQGRKENSIVVADVSGSMTGEPMQVSIALAMYIAERNTGPYHNKFITFSDNPELVSLSGDNVVERVKNLSQAQWSMTTDFVKVFKRILQVAVSNSVKQEDMIKTVYVISDMEFNQAGGAYTPFEEIQARYKAAGYEMPKLVFWNVRSGRDQLPVAKETKNTVLVSGFSTNAIAQLIGSEGIPTPYEHMLSVLNSERYARIVV